MLTAMRKFNLSLVFKYLDETITFRIDNFIQLVDIF